LGFTKCISEQAVYKRGAGKTAIILGVYVDDLIVTGSEKKEVEIFKKQMTEEFEMSDLGLMSFYLGIEVDQQIDFMTETIRLCQESAEQVWDVRLQSNQGTHGSWNEVT
jgi:hypothetical protein